MTILIESDASTAGMLRGALGPQTDVVATLAAAQALLADSPLGHDLVVVGADVELEPALQLASSQRVANPGLGVVLLRRRVSSRLLREAMVAGVRDVVAVDDVTSLADACRRSRELSAQVRAGQGLAAGGSRGHQGRIVSVFAAKGGCGKTTLATNLACALTRAGRRVCLLDLDLAFGDVAIALGLTPRRTVADALNLSRLDETAVRSLVTGHPSGLDTILAPVEPGTAESISGALVGDLLDQLRSIYDVVVVDSPPAFTDHVLAAFDRTDAFVLPATLDIPALKNLKLTLETLSLLSYPADRQHVVLNRSDAKVGLSVADVERTLQTVIALQVPSSQAVPASINRGVPIVLDQAGHPVSTAITTFAREQLLEAQPAGVPESPWAPPAAPAPTKHRRRPSLRRRSEVAV